MGVSEGYGVAGPRSSGVAKALLEAAQALGLESSVVRTTIGGYIAPVAVIQRYEETLGVDTEEIPVQSDEKSDFPDDSWKVADIKEWAQSHEVDLGGATKKADMLVALRTTDKEE